MGDLGVGVGVVGGWDGGGDVEGRGGRVVVVRSAGGDGKGWRTSERGFGEVVLFSARILC